MDTLSAFIPLDRRHSMAGGEDLPDRTVGAALFADISGFTPLTEALARELGPQRGAEELTNLLNRIYDALIAEVDRFGGSVVMFSGDAITCWFDQDERPFASDATLSQPDGLADAQPQSRDAKRQQAAALRATACALGMQAAIAPLSTIVTASGTTIALIIKVAVTCGPARRFLVGDPRIQRIDVLAGRTLDQLAAAESLAAPGEIVLDVSCADQLGDWINVIGRRASEKTDTQIVVVGGLTRSVNPTPWPQISANAIDSDESRQWLLPAIIARLQQSTSPFFADLRPALALFLSFSGIDYDNDDDASILLDAYVRRVQAVLAHYDSFLLQLTMGDKGSYLYAAVGAPVAHDDDAMRAIAAALDLQSVPPQLSFITNVRIGIAQGQMYAGTYGSAIQRTYGVLGDKTNLAARLMSMAENGTIWCDEATYQHAKRYWTFDELPARRVKGKSELIRVYRPTGHPVPSSYQNLLEVQSGQTEAARKMVGRAAEIARLKQAVASVRAGTGHVLQIEGEAGIGKSRLVAELIQQAQAVDLRLLLGAGQSIEQQTPYRAWRDVFSAYFDLNPLSHLAEQQAQVQRMVQDIAPKLLPRLPLLNDLLNLKFPETPLTAALDPMLRQESLVGLLTNLLRLSAHQRPLLIVIEDAHWLDSLSWSLVLQIARSLIAAGEPVLLVVTHRPFEEQLVGAQHAATLRGLAFSEVLTLGVLSSEDTLNVVATYLGIPIEGLFGPIETLMRRAGGNPFFAEELISTLRDRNLISITYGSHGTAEYRVVEDLQRIRAILPDTLQGLILARIDRLPHDRQLTVKIAAVIGHSFAYSPLYATLAAYTGVVTLTLQEQLKELARRNLTSLEALEPELTYVFRHIITQEVAYETLLFAQRQQIHRIIAEWYEQTYGGSATNVPSEQADDQPLSPVDRLAPYLTLLVHHYHQAGDQSRERHYAQLAGEQAAAQSASVEAAMYLSRALELTPEHDSATRYALLRTREQVYDFQGTRTAQLHDLEKLTSLAEDLDDTARRAYVMLRRSMYATATSDYPMATTLGQQAVELAQAAGVVAVEATASVQWGRALLDQANYEAARTQLSRALMLAQQLGLSNVAADCLVKRGLAAYFQGDYARAQDDYANALQLAHQIGDRPVEAKAMVGIGQVAGSQGKYDLAREQYQEALAIFRTVGDRRRESWAHSTLGDLAISLSDYKAAQQSYEETLSIAHAIGDRFAESHALNSLGLIIQNQGDFVEATRVYSQAIQIGQSIGNKWVESGALANLGLLLHHQGDAEASLERSRASLQIALDINYQRNQSFAWTVQGHALLTLNRLAEAAAAYTQALNTWRELGENNLVPDALAGLARVALAQGDLALAQTHVEAILAHLETGIVDGAGEPFLVYLTCYLVLNANRDPLAQNVLATSYALLQERAAKFGDPTIQHSFLTNIPAHRKLSRRAQEQLAADA